MWAPDTTLCCSCRHAQWKVTTREFQTPARQWILYSFCVALSYEQLGDITAATQSYRGIVSLLDETFGESLDQKVLVEWAEEALRRAIIMLISRAQYVDGIFVAMPKKNHTDSNRAVDDVKAMLEFIRGYQKVTYNVSSSWRPHKRLYALRLSIKYLSDLYKNGRYPSGTDASM